MNTTQEHLNIDSVIDDLVLLEDGGAVLVLQVSAVNFGLLSEREQMAIIQSFAQMLNSLSFAIQIVIHSTRIDISSYLRLLDRAQLAQTNPQLSQMIVRYKNFIQSTIKENDVLDKKFYIAISLSSVELGLGFLSAKERAEKIKTILLPKRDQVIRQLNRVGLKATQLGTATLIKTFFDIYNPPVNGPVQNVQVPQVTLSNPQPINIPPKPIPNIPTPSPVVAIPATPLKSRNHPFVVEELSDNI